MATDPRGDEFGQQSIRVYVSTLREIIDEQYRLRSETGERPGYADVVAKAWSAYKEKLEEDGDQESSRDPRLQPLIEDLLAFYFSKPTDDEPHKKALVQVLHQLFPNPLARKNPSRRSA